MKTTALILAAGRGTRMHSDAPKVLAGVLGDPMLRHVREALRPAFGDDVIVVTGHGADLVERALPGGRFVRQEEQLGTGHAVQCALPALKADGCRRVFVVNGDAPLLTPDIVASFLEGAAGADLAFASIVLDDPAAYGRIIRDAEGRVTGIVEAKDYDAARLGPAGGEVNAGMYVMDLALAERLLPRLKADNAGGEYYLTDLVALALADGGDVRGIPCGRDERLLGVNSPGELAAAEEILRAATAARLLDSGVRLHAPDLVRVSPLSTVEPGADITGPCEIRGASRIGRGAVIESHCVIRDSVVEGGAEIRSFSHLENAHVGRGALVGPYARLRPGADLGEESHVGNFVELKKARLGRGAKANHLSYLGDADIGAGTNIGAGTITCNYDGRDKHRTVIGERAFIGSNSAMVAPVTVGSDTLVGAGSVITQDVPDGHWGIARGRQRNIPVRKR